MTRIFIIHGTGGNPDANWFPWLKNELEKEGCAVYAPRFPTPTNQSLTSWESEFQKDGYYGLVDESSIFVGHSLGPAFILSVLERSPKPVKACFFVSGFLGLLNNPAFDDLNKTFTTRTFDWKKIRDMCRTFQVINSDNDPYVQLAKGRELAKKLETELIVLHNAGHINQESGHVRFEFLLELMRKEL